MTLTGLPFMRFHAYTAGAANSMTLHTNWARTIEVLHAAELIGELLRDPDLQNEDLIVTPAADDWILSSVVAIFTVAIVCCGLTAAVAGS